MMHEDVWNNIDSTENRQLAQFPPWLFGGMSNNSLEKYLTRFRELLMSRKDKYEANA